MLLKTGQCFTEELKLNCPTIVDCVTSLPLGNAATAGVTKVLGSDGLFHIIPPPVAPTPQTISLTGQTLTLSAGGGTVTLPDQDTQDLSIVGNIISLTNGGSVVLPTSAAPIPQVLSVAGQVLALSGGGGSVLLPDLDTQDLSLVGNVLSLTNGGSVTLPVSPPTPVTAGAGISVSGTGVTGNPYVVSQQPKLHAASGTGECPTINFYPGLSSVGDVMFVSSLMTLTNPSSIYPASGTFTIETPGFNSVTYPGSIYTIGTEVSINGSAWSPLSQMSFSNQGGSTPENYTGSAIPSATRNVSIGAGATLTLQTRGVLVFKGPLTANDVVSSVCIGQNAILFNHD
jgi:hypothetical protein